MSTVTPLPWVLLMFQLPTRPTAARVRTWRRLQHLGAVQVKNSGYALPYSEAALEDFEWLRADIRAAGGDAMVFLARTTRDDAEAELRGALSGTETAMTQSPEPILKASAYRNRTWVTRTRPGIDRFASAWLIQRFIDPKATFAFADTPPSSRSRAVPFDMFGVEFGHQRGGCTFDTLMRRFAIKAPRLTGLADLIRTVDLKLDIAASPDAAVVARMVEGLRAVHEKDAVLLSRGIEMIEALYQSAPADARGARARRTRH